MTELVAYWLGFYQGDYHASKNIKLTHEKIELGEQYLSTKNITIKKDNIFQVLWNLKIICVWIDIEYIWMIISMCHIFILLI